MRDKFGCEIMNVWCEIVAYMYAEGNRRRESGRRFVLVIGFVYAWTRGQRCYRYTLTGVSNGSKFGLQLYGL